MSPAYREPGCGYRSLIWVTVLLAAAVGADIAIGGARSHLLAWVVAAVVLLGVDLLIVRATRQFKTLTVTAEEVRVGEDALELASVVSAQRAEDDGTPALGWSSGPPRKRPVVALVLADDRRVLVPTRHPAQLLAALGKGAPAAVAQVRAAVAGDHDLLAEIDERADAVFRVSGYDLPAVEFADPDTAAALFVAGTPVCGFARVDLVDGGAHLSALAVLPASMKQGVGGALIDVACAWARSQGHASMTLTTYADVPWNAPMYARRGWVVVDDPGPELRALRARETDLGLDDVGPRVALRRAL